MKDKIRIGVSACLLGKPVRYDGGHKLDHYLKDTLGQYVEWLPVCPEVECGLPVPRESMRLVGDPDSPRLVTRKTGVDHTAGMQRWAEKRLRDIEKENLCGFIFKSRSPSSGMRGVKVYSASGMPGRTTSGVFARAFMNSFPFVPVEDEGRLHDPGIRENFIERVFVFKRWQDMLTGRYSIKKLVAFHTDHKLLIMSHSAKHLGELGRIVAHASDYPPRTLPQTYLEILMQALQLEATVKKNVNVLQHIMGYFKSRLAADEKRELLEVVQQYHDGLIPLIVPVTLLKHFVRKYDEPYLKNQYYLNPHPINLMLRNHV